MKDRAFTIVVCFEDPRRERFLMVRHRTRGWELPGGRLEPGESPEACARREFEEETGHRLESVRPVLQQERSNGTAWVFEGTWGAAIARDGASEEAIQETRFVRRLGEVQPLAFPDDPYAEIEHALRRSLR